MDDPCVQGRSIAPEHACCEGHATCQLPQNQRTYATDRSEEEPCERGTDGCSNRPPQRLRALRDLVTHATGASSGLSRLV